MFTNASLSRVQMRQCHGTTVTGGMQESRDVKS